MECVDIIMGIYNCEKYIDDSIKSLLKQSFKNWRLIMCDDGSTDSTYSIAQSYVRKYKNIILLKNQKNMGLNYTLNKCLSEVSSKYVARMDADDICDKNRLLLEYEFLESHDDYSFVSSNANFFDEKGYWGSISYEEKPNKYSFINGSPFCHASVMIRTSALKHVNGYSVDDRLLRVEDYHLWFKMYEKGYKGYNIQNNLYDIRDDRNATRRRTWKNRINEFYVKWIGFKMLHIPWYYYIFAFRPLVLGLVPTRVYEKIHRAKFKDTKR